jgi:hypothetical protein
MNATATKSQKKQPYAPISIPVAGPLPNTYLLLDVKRSGYQPDDVIVQVCHMVVEDGKPTKKDCWLVDWSYFEEDVPRQWLADRLACPSDHQLTIQDLDGACSIHDVLGTYQCLLCHEYAGWPIVGHSVFKSDLLDLRNHFFKWMEGFCLDFIQMPCWDVGLMQKAMDGGLQIWQGEPIGEFHRRVILNRLPGVLWSLDHCLKLYGLKIRADRSDPYYRLYAAHEVYQAQRKLINTLTAAWASYSTTSNP